MTATAEPSPRYEAAVQREMLDMAATIAALRAESRDAFLNRVRSLHNIDRDRLPELADGEWPRFRDDPVGYLLRANDRQADAIWREVERRQQ